MRVCRLILNFYSCYFKSETSCYSNSNRVQKTCYFCILSYHRFSLAGFLFLTISLPLGQLLSWSAQKWNVIQPSKIKVLPPKFYSLAAMPWLWWHELKLLMAVIYHPHLTAMHCKEHLHKACLEEKTNPGKK